MNSLSRWIPMNIFCIHNLSVTTGNTILILIAFDFLQSRHAPSFWWQPNHRNGLISRFIAFSSDDEIIAAPTITYKELSVGLRNSLNFPPFTPLINVWNSFFSPQTFLLCPPHVPNHVCRRQTTLLVDTWVWFPTQFRLGCNLPLYISCSLQSSYIPLTSTGENFFRYFSLQ